MVSPNDEEELARIARGLAPEKAQALLAFARFLAGGAPAPPVLVAPDWAAAHLRVFRKPDTLAGRGYGALLGLTLLMFLACLVIGLVQCFHRVTQGGFAWWHVASPLLAVAGILALLANTLWVLGDFRRVPEDLPEMELRNALKTLNVRLWRPLLLCLPLSLCYSVVLLGQLAL